MKSEMWGKILPVSCVVQLDQRWAEVLTGGPRWLVKFDQEAGAGAAGRSVLVTHLKGGKHLSWDMQETWALMSIENEQTMTLKTV